MRIKRDRFKPGTCNTIDDVTGAIVKLSDTMLRWDGIRCTKENWEPRQPQDFPVTPRPITSFSQSRADITMPAVPPLTTIY